MLNTVAALAAATGLVVLFSGQDAMADQAKSEQECLAEAIYFEARGESEKGQLAVGQVILNRVESARFPDTVCGVVYENASRHNRCQFSFACDGQPEVISEKASWEKIEEHAETLLDCDEDCRGDRGWTGGLWTSTHYHATSVNPSWANVLPSTGRVGRHRFYIEASS